MDTYWEQEFRGRMGDFAVGMGSSVGHPISIKVRITGGCFHREHSPEAFKIIDHELHMYSAPGKVRLEEHETGPELLVVLAVTAAGLNLATSLVNLVTAIIKARSEGIKKGDSQKEPVELIVRGYDQKGKYFEEKVLKISPMKS